VLGLIALCTHKPKTSITTKCCLGFIQSERLWRTAYLFLSDRLTQGCLLSFAFAFALCFCFMMKVIDACIKKSIDALCFIKKSIDKVINGWWGA
jgi:hypothetical protein